jgi:hypothetical protein
MQENILCKIMDMIWVMSVTDQPINQEEKWKNFLVNTVHIVTNISERG